MILQNASSTNIPVKTFLKKYNTFKFLRLFIQYLHDFQLIEHEKMLDSYHGDLKP